MIALAHDVFNNKRFIFKDCPVEAATVALFAKATKTFGAIQLLCKSGYGEDAAVLLRVLLENCIVVRYIAEDKSGARAKTYFQYHDILRQQALQRIKKRKLWRRVHPTIDLKTEKEINESYKHAKELFPKSRRRYGWAGILISQMASRVNLGPNYEIVYWEISHLVHSNIMAVNKYVERHKSGAVVLYIEPGENYLVEVLPSSYGYFLMILNVVNDVFNLGLDQAIEDAQRFLRNN